MTPSTIAVLATLDTKGEEAAFAAQLIRARGHHSLVVDMGLAGVPLFRGDISREQLAEIRPARGEGTERVVLMQDAAAATATVLQQKIHTGTLHAVLAIGGGTGKWIADAALSSLPLGFPRLLVTTVPHGDGRTDIALMPSVADVAGLNRVIRPILNNAVGAICGMAEQPHLDEASARTTIAMTMFGVTTPGGNEVRRILEEAGCEVVVFHATGAGGDTMERLVRAGMFDAVVDWTTTEITDRLTDGLCACGPDRLEAASGAGIPQVIVPGAVDVINVHAPIPERFSDRTHHWHLPTVPLIRTSAEESRKVGEWIAGKLNRATGPVAVVIPDGGFSTLDHADGEFWDPVANAAFADGLGRLRGDIPVRHEPGNINDPSFAQAVAQAVLAMLPQPAHPHEEAVS